MRLQEDSRYSALLVCTLLLTALPTPAVGQVNSWTKPTSGNWEEQSSWSLGVLPNASQSVYITNPGWKAVAIGASTAQNFPASMQIQELRIESPPDSFNELLMNFSGFAVPLQTTSLSVVGTNSAVVLLSSMLEVTDTNANSGNVYVGGTIIQGDFSQVKVSGFMSIGRFNANAAYYLTNGSLSIINVLEVGGGLGRSAKFVQYGGSNTSGALNVNNEGEYDLYGGDIIANGVSVGGGDFATTSSFYQYGGTVASDMVVNGYYILNGGTITGRMTMAYDPSVGRQERPDASVLQTGGTNFASAMDLGHPNKFGGRAFYTLSNGVVHVDSSVAFNGGQFSQLNGQVTIASNLVLQGTDLASFGFVTADYFLERGTLTADGLTAHHAIFQQDGGSNLIAGDINIVGDPTPPHISFGPQSVRYGLSSGFLSTRNLTVTAGYNSGFGQNGGSNEITEKLTLQGVAFGTFDYTLAGGTLTVKDIYIAEGAFFQHTNGTIIHSGLLTLSQGEWRAAAAAQSLGPLRVTVGSSNNNSAIIFPGGSSTVRLANSSAQPWAPNAILYVTNWHGSTSGGGATQLYFGSNSIGLTAQQLSQIRFALSTGLYPATILSTGEVVPAGTATLDYTRNGGTLTLTWPPGWFLQSATDVIGPYLDVEATSPYPVDMTSPQQFFRLRQ